MSLGFSPDSIIISIRSSMQASTNLQQICENILIFQWNTKLTNFLPQITRGNLHRDFPGHEQSVRKENTSKTLQYQNLPDLRFQGENILKECLIYSGAFHIYNEFPKNSLAVR